MGKSFSLKPIHWQKDSEQCFQYDMGGSIDGSTPKWSILMGIFPYKPSILGNPPFMETPIYCRWYFPVNCPLNQSSKKKKVNWFQAHGLMDYDIPQYIKVSRVSPNSSSTNGGFISQNIPSFGKSPSEYIMIQEEWAPTNDLK